MKVEDQMECGVGFNTPQAKWFSWDAHDLQPSCIWPQLGHRNVDKFDPRVCLAQEVSSVQKIYSGDLTRMREDLTDGGPGPEDPLYLKNIVVPFCRRRLRVFEMVLMMCSICSVQGKDNAALGLCRP